MDQDNASKALEVLTNEVKEWKSGDIADILD